MQMQYLCAAVDVGDVCCHPLRADHVVQAELSDEGVPAACKLSHLCQNLSRYEQSICGQDQCCMDHASLMKMTS